LNIRARTRDGARQEHQRAQGEDADNRLVNGESVGSVVADAAEHRERQNHEELASGQADGLRLHFIGERAVAAHQERAQPEEEAGLASDVIFVGGADRDRVPLVAALIATGLRVALYGGYWNRYAPTREHHRGHADPRTIRQATAAAKIALCLVRRANRDGHVMRSFEIPAIGACMLVEETEEHREIFSIEGETVVYFRSIPEMIDKARA